MSKKVLYKRLFIFYLSLVVIVFISFFPFWQTKEPIFIFYGLIFAVFATGAAIWVVWPTCPAHKAKKILLGRCQTERKIWLSRSFLKSIRNKNKELRKRGARYRWYIVQQGCFSSEPRKSFNIGNNLFLVLKEKSLRL